MRLDTSSSRPMLRGNHPFQELLRKHLRPRLGEPHIGPALMLPEKAARDRELQAGAVFGRLTAMLGQKRPVDLLDVDTPILNGFDRAGDLQELSHRYFRIGERTRLLVFHLMAAAGEVGSGVTRTRKPTKSGRRLL